MQLARALSTRFLLGLLSLLFISFVTFLADEIQPGDAATVLAGEKASAETIERLRENLGLNRPWPIRYVEFVSKAVRGDFGTSYYGVKEPVGQLVGRNVTMTITIASCAILLASAIGIFLGTLAAVWQNKPPDQGILFVSTFGVTLPNFVLAPILAYFFALQWDVLPLTWSVDRVAPDYYYLILPVIVLAMRPTALLTRLTRASMVETLRQEFIRTAIAKGVPPFRMYVKHALRNAILPVITAIGTSFGFLLTGSFVVETYFLLPGLGSTTIDAIRKGDIPVVQACVMLTGAIFIVLNLFVDLILPILDPRIRESQV
ncbi:DppB ABC-type dipeptide/oligopeptide/nickel transport systems, permease components [Fimbriimonadaceae bacterium]